MTYALEVAQRTGATITVLYVVYPNEGVDNNMYDAFFIDDYVQQRLNGMKHWIKKFDSPHLKEVKIDLKCIIGFPIGTICQTAVDINASLIVMGTVGATGLRGILLGSTTSGVIGSSKIPVLAVPSKAVFRSFARFAFATDFNLTLSRTSLKIMRELLNVQHTGLNIVCVLDEFTVRPSAQDERKMSEKLDTIPHEFHYLHNKNVEQAIHNFLESTECNGLVTVAHKHSWLKRLFIKSTTQTLAQQTTVPMLVLYDVE
jgi:nucleotide-binding universal stress UspA family protein